RGCRLLATRELRFRPCSTRSIPSDRRPLAGMPAGRRRSGFCSAALLLELRGAPADRGRHAFGCGELAKALAEFGLRGIERRDDIEPDMDAIGKSRRI